MPVDRESLDMRVALLGLAAGKLSTPDTPQSLGRDTKSQIYLFLHLLSVMHLRPFVRDHARGKPTYPIPRTPEKLASRTPEVVESEGQARQGALCNLQRDHCRILNYEVASGCQSSCSKVSQFIIVALALD